MIRAIDSKPLDLSDDEFEYYVQIIAEFGDKIFQETFEVDENEGSAYYGFITLVKPSMNAQLPLGLVYFLLNVQMNQRLREFEKTIEELKKWQLKIEQK